MMKARIICLLALCLALLIVLPAMAAGTYDELTALQARMSDAATALTDNGYTVMRMEVGSFGAYETVDTQFILAAGETYKIIGIGDDEVADLDLTLADEEGNDLATDVLVDEMAAIDFTPEQDYAATISCMPASLSEDADETGDHYYSLLIAVKNEDYDLAADLDEAIGRTFDAMQNLSDEEYAIERAVINLATVDEETLFTADLHAEALYMIQGVGGAGVSNLNLSIYDWDEGVIATNDMEDPAPVIEQQPEADVTYSIGFSVAGVEEDCDPSGNYYSGAIVAVY